jgi:Tol biopolymer transport system component
MITGSDDSSLTRVKDLSSKQGWGFLVYYSLRNKTYYVSNGRADLVYPQTNVAKQLGLPWNRDLDHSAEPAISPDGKHVAYVRRRSSAAHDEAIAIFDVGSNTSRDLTTLTKDVYRLYWSPNGKEISFVAHLDLFIVKLYSVDLDTGAVSELNPGRKSITMSWSPDGKEFVVADAPDSDADTTGAGLFVINRATKVRRKIGDGAAPSWSSDGKLIAYLDGEKEECYTTTPDGSRREKLFSYKPLLPTGYRLMGPLVWSPDMRYLIFQREDGTKSDHRKVYLFDLQTKEKVEILSGGPFHIVGCVPKPN